YSAYPPEQYVILNRMIGPYKWYYWSLILANGIVPQLLWFRKVRYNHIMLFLIAVVISIGMWLERFVIVITSLSRDLLPSSWGMFHATKWDWGLFIGTLGFFFFLLFVFLRVLPMINVFEMRELR
ncbi:MAG: hypothetical protein B6243_00115, partial [Anaerolineaceae bacterium 4572_5.2]